MFNSHIGRANYPKVLVGMFLGFSDSARPARHTARSDSGDADLARGEHRIGFERGPDKAEERAIRNESEWGRRSRVAGKTRATADDTQSWSPHLPMGAFAHVELCFIRLQKKTFPGQILPLATRADGFSIRGLPILAGARTNASGYTVLYYVHGEHSIFNIWLSGDRASFVPSRRFSPALKFLTLAHSSVKLLDAFSLIYSLPS